VTVKLSTAIPADWKNCEPYLAKAIARVKDWSLQGVALAALRGDIVLWKVEEDDIIIGSGATQIEQTQDTRRLTVLLFSGEGNWFESFPQLKQVAADCGCNRIYGEGRPGWLRKLGATPIIAWELPIGDAGHNQESS
jgi:hypothetical protein